ncbi:MAG: hypothetical protein QNJ47_04930 [Nostocaceae cyanobacterium]|nr:hypothetical protein [Nostocaceae cyanobacterium]
MNHPFALDISDLESIELDLEEEISNEEALQVEGGLSIYTDALHENGDPIFTTEAIGEEGGCKPYPLPCYPIKPPEVTTKALGEEGGDVTTLALGEEGGDCYVYY